MESKQISENVLLNTKQFSVNWSNHMNHVRSVFHMLFTARELVDVTLYCEGRKTGAHKMLLSACSSYFREVFRDNPCQHPVIILKGVQYQILQDILSFMYNGEVSIDSNNFDAFIKTAQLLQVSGLTETANLPQESQPESERKEERRMENEESKMNNITMYDEETHEEISQEEYANTFKQPVVEKIPKPMAKKTIKFEPTEEVFEEEPQDPLQHDGIPDDPGTDFDVSMMNVYTDDYRESKIGTIENVCISSETVTSTPMRQSAFSESSLKCTVCHKIFSHPYSLHHHKAVHSGSTECPICHAVLSRKYNLKIHMKARHQI